MKTTNFRTYELAVELYERCGRVKARGELKSQLERASLSAALNLSEGAAKPTVPDKRRFYAMAYGSIRETQTLLRLLNEAELFTKADELGAHAYKLMQATK